MRFTTAIILGLILGTPLLAQSATPFVPPQDRGLKKFLSENPQLVVPDNAPSTVTIAPTTEPGERLEVSGHVTDGKVPVVGAALYVYHTDEQGFYKPGCSDCRNHILISRLHGAIRTDAAGGYHFETIRPGRYGDGPSHIHMVVTTPEAGWQYELTFADDPVAIEWSRSGTLVLPKYYSPGAVSVRPAIKDAKGVWHVTEDIVLKRD